MQVSSSAASDEQAGEGNGEGNDDGVSGGIDLTFGREYTEAALWELEWLPYLIRLALARSPGALRWLCVGGSLLWWMDQSVVCMCVWWWSVVWIDWAGRGRAGRSIAHSLPLLISATGMVTRGDVALLKSEVCGLDSFYVTGAWMRE